jgi:hypothetical protein
MAYLGCTFTTCTTWIGDPVCRIDCANRHEGYEPAFTSWAMGVASCGQECGWGRHWECVTPHGVSPGPFVGSGTTQVTIRVLDNSANKGMAHVSVAACSHSSPSSCTEPVQTDENGLTPALTIDKTLPSHVTFFRLESQLGTQMLVYPGRTFTGESESLSFQWFDTAGTGAPTSDPVMGLVITSMGDCVGSADIGSPSTTFAIDGGPPAVYGIGATAGQFGYFPSVPPGVVTVRGFAPEPLGEVVSAQAHVEKGATTVVHFNFPVWVQ